MSDFHHEPDDYALDDGSKVAVIGGGPTGSFFSIFALKMAKMVGKDIEITIFEPKDFRARGPGSCNRCGGIVSELLVQTLAVEGISLPSSVIQKGINTYNLHTVEGSVLIETPAHEKTIAAIYRGTGPKEMGNIDKDSFDAFLLEEAVKEGAVHKPLKIDWVERSNGRPVLYCKGEKIMEADLLVGAHGVNSFNDGIFNELNFGYKTPEVTKTAIAEISFGKEEIERRFGNSVHLFLLPIDDIKFAAMIPKTAYVTLCILGKNMNREKVQTFLDHPVVRDLIPKEASSRLGCMCLPKMNVGAPEKPFTDRVVMCGDAGSTRLFKDGIGAAYMMGKSAAKTAVFDGVSKDHFREHYLPVYKSIIKDNRYGSFLFGVTDLYRKFRFLTYAMLKVVEGEQADSGNGNKVFSSILWDMFTGNERYRNIFYRAFNIRMKMSTAREILRFFSGGSNGN
jgi:flavin-dependent dehydrogenase